MSAPLPPLPAGVRRAFVAYVDVHFGSSLVEQLTAQGVEVTGLLHSPDSVISNPKIKKLLKRSDPEGIRKALLDSDYIVFQMVDGAADAMAAVKLLHSNHFDVEKRFVLVSSLMTWFETTPLSDPGNNMGDEDAAELEPLTEDQFNRRVPHLKYLAWREAEKLVAAAHCDRLKTFVVFAGLTYGKGEELLHPLFKHAWSLASDGLPIFGSGKQSIPMIHVSDLSKLATKLLAAEELPENRYMFAADDGNVTWNDLVRALNTALGNGKTYRVATHEYCLHDNVEQFIVNLKVDPQQLQSIMSGDEDWVSKSGFVENIDLIVSQYREARGITPLRILILGAPSSGKSHTARELGEFYRTPSFDISDIITEYKYQETELKQELQRLRAEKSQAKLQERLDEKRQALLEERKAQREALLAEAAEGDAVPNDDNDDVEEEEEIEVSLSPEEQKEILDAAAENDGDDERLSAINEKLEEIKKVLSLRVKPASDASLEPPNPKDKKKPAPPPKKDAKKGPATASNADEQDESAKDNLRFTDRALAIMTRWKLSRTQCRNQGYALSGFPKSIRQARLLFEDSPIEVPEDGADDGDAVAPQPGSVPQTITEADLADMKPTSDSLFPTHVVLLKASDAFLLERLQRTQHEHPHNNPEDFQRRLDFYKQHFEGPVSVYGYLESCRTTNGRGAVLKQLDAEVCPLVLPPPPTSQYAAKEWDAMTLKCAELIGKPHNFGPTPQDVQREKVRQQKLLAEQQADAEAQLKKRKEKEALEVNQAQKTLEEARFATSKIREAERQMLEARKAPLKAFLMQQVIPVLTKGLIEVCNRRPEDPVDFLAEWLFRHNPEDDDHVYQ